MPFLSVAIEGIDGCGKTTLSHAVTQQLVLDGLRARHEKLVTHLITVLKAHIDSVTGVPGSYQEVVRDDERGELYAIEANLTLARLDASADIDVVVFDRWFPIIACQTGPAVPWKPGDPIGALFRRTLRSPDLTFWLEIPVQLAAERLTLRGDWMAQRYSPPQLATELARLKERYETRFGQRSDVVRLDGSARLEILAAAVRRRIVRALPQYIPRTATPHQCA